MHEYIRDLNDPEQKGGAFNVPVLLHGKWVGMLTGRVEMLEFEGPSPDGTGELARQLNELDKWKALLEFARGSEEAKRNMGATTIQQTAAAVVVTEKTERAEVNAAPTADEAEAAEASSAAVTGPQVQEQTEEAAVHEDDSDVAKPVKIYNFNGRELKAPKVAGADGAEEEEEEDEEEVDDDEAEASMEVYLQHSEVIYKDGRKVPENEFVCSITGESLLEQDFVIHKGQPFSRKAYLDQFADHVDGNTLQPLQKGDNVVLAMGYKWKIEVGATPHHPTPRSAAPSTYDRCHHYHHHHHHHHHLPPPFFANIHHRHHHHHPSPSPPQNFRCAGTGKPLNFEQFMVQGGKPYSVEAYVDKFRVCPTCNETVPIGDDSAMEWMGMIFHAHHFVCTGTGVALKPGDKVFAKDLGDGMGPRPYCSSSYAEQFCPVCPGCSEFVLPDESSVNACGSVWHQEHFRCAATGVQLDMDYHEHDGMPYSEKAFFDLFGISCSTCGEVIKADALSVLGQSWHPECFICQSSGLPISQDGESNFVDWFEEAHMVYNKHEFGKLFGSRCHYCEELVVEDIRVTTPEVNGVIVERSYHPGDETTAVFTRTFGYAAQAPPNDAPTCSTRSPSSELSFKTLTSDQKPRYFHPLLPPRVPPVHRDRGRARPGRRRHSLRDRRRVALRGAQVLREVRQRLHRRPRVRRDRGALPDRRPPASYGELNGPHGRQVTNKPRFSLGFLAGGGGGICPPLHHGCRSSTSQ